MKLLPVPEPDLWWTCQTPIRRLPRA